MVTPQEPGGSGGVGLNQITYQSGSGTAPSPPTVGGLLAGQ